MTGPSGWVMLLIALVAYLLPCQLHGSDLEKGAQAEYVGKVLTLRRFYEGRRLQFDAKGQLIGQGITGSWTTDGQIEIDSVSLTDKRLQLKGRRRVLVFDSPNEQPRDVIEISAGDPLAKMFRQFDQKPWKDFIKNANIEVNLELPSAPKTEGDFALAMNTVFLGPEDKLGDVVPVFWTYFVLKQSGKRWRPKRTLTQIGKGDSAPRPLYTPDPEYSETARRIGFEGTVIFRVTVTESGSLEDLQVTRPLGLGLDDKAAQAVSTWRFQPARKDGNPVPVEISVETSFRFNRASTDNSRRLLSH